MKFRLLPARFLLPFLASMDFVINIPRTGNAFERFSASSNVVRHKDYKDTIVSNKTMIIFSISPSLHRMAKRSPHRPSPPDSAFSIIMEL